MYPLAEDAAAVTNVGTGGATLLSITLTVVLEDDEKLLLLIDDEFDIPASTLDGPWLFPTNGYMKSCVIRLKHNWNI